MGWPEAGRCELMKIQRKSIDFHDFSSVWRRGRRILEDFASQTMNTHSAGVQPGRLGTRISQSSRAELARAGRADGKLAETVGALQIGSKTVKMNVGNDALDGCRCVDR